MPSDEFITEAARRIVRDPSTGTLTELLERAFDAGRESAYTTVPDISWEGMPTCPEGCTCGEITLGKTQLDWLLAKVAGSANNPQAVKP